LKENSAVFKNIKNNYTINIQGTSQEVTKSKGRTSIEIQTSKYIIPHNFQIVNLEFAILCDGILGIDFIKKYNCQIGSKPSKDWLIIRTNNLKYPIYLPKTSDHCNVFQAEVMAIQEATSEHHDADIYIFSTSQAALRVHNTIITCHTSRLTWPSYNPNKSL